MNNFFGIAVHDGKVGILDIGSNSVRLVVYDGMKRAPMPVFNEKSMCELGKNVAVTGKLNPKGVAEAKECIARFLTMARVMDVVELSILATAAVRDAEDGKAFVKEIEEAHGVTVKVISGKQEAQLAAKGVLAALHKPQGLVGDLGGGSFELVRLQDGTPHEQDTLPLGALRLKEESGSSVSQAANRAREAYNELGWLKNHRYDAFYAVGGSFRALAHAYMLKVGYPLEVLHAYEVETVDFLPFLRKLAATDAATIADMPGASRKRAANLPFAAVALAELLEHTGIQRIIFSTAGIREGYLFDQLSPYLRQEDGLIACCVDLASQNGRVGSYARDLFNWMTPLFDGETEDERRLRFACCVLSEFAWRIHPQYRAEWQFMRIIQSSIISMNHSERVRLAKALYHRYTLKTDLDTKVLKLLSRKELLWCEAMGQVMSAGFSLSGGMSNALPKMPLAYDNGKITVETVPEFQDLLTDAVWKKLDGLGETLSALRSRAK